MAIKWKTISIPRQQFAGFICDKCGTEDNYGMSKIIFQYCPGQEGHLEVEIDICYECNDGSLGFESMIEQLHKIFPKAKYINQLEGIYPED